MRLATAVKAMRDGQLWVLGRLMRLSVPVYRASWLAAACSEGILRELREPRSFDALASALGVAQGASDGLRAWLQFGVKLGEIEEAGQGYRLRGSLSRSLARPEFDAAAALLEEAVDLHLKLLRSTVSLARQGRKFTLADQSGELIARSSRALEPFVFDAVDEAVPAKGVMRLLEIGCGSGTYIRRACERNPEVTALGLELQPEVAAQARANLEKWGLSSRAKVEAGDVRGRSASAEFDLATLHNNIYYFPVAARVELLRHVRGFLAPGGALLLTTGCQGGSLPMEALNLWAAATENCGPLPTSEEMVAQLREAGFESARAARMMPGESYFAFFARNPA